MPNHVKNIIEFQCDEKRLKQILNAIQVNQWDGDAFGIGTFDFGKIIPMPPALMIESGSQTDRSIELYLTAINPDSEVFDTKKFSRKEFENLCLRLNIEKMFGKYRNNLTAADIATITKYSSQDELMSLGKTAVENLLNYGATTWYEWSIRHWGTKWNSYTNSLNSNTLSFETAWSAPHPVIQKLSEMFSDVSFSHGWADEDIGSNCGKREYLGGEMIADLSPDTEKECVEFAAEMWGYDLEEDLQYRLNVSGTKYIYLDAREYEHILLFDKDMLFVNERLVESDIPQGMYVYHLRESDDGSGFATVEKSVKVNHGGSIITTDPLDLGKDGYIEFNSESYPNFTGEQITIGQFLKGEFSQEETEGMHLC